MTTEKLKVRTAIKKRKPTFTRRQGIRQFSKLKKSGWRAPKGMGNKQRRGRKGQPIKPSCGFGSPKTIRGTDRNGLVEVLIYNINDLTKLENKNLIGVISSNVGKKKKLEILKIANEKKISFSNVKDIKTTIEKLTKIKKVVKKDNTKSSNKKQELKKEDITENKKEVKKKVESSLDKNISKKTKKEDKSNNLNVEKEDLNVKVDSNKNKVDKK